MVYNVGTVQQIVQRLHSDGYHVSEYALRRWIKDGVIPSVHTGKKFLITYDRVLDYLKAGTIAPANSTTAK